MLRTTASVIVWGGATLAVVWAAGALINAILTAPLLGWAAMATFVNYGLLPAFGLALASRVISVGLSWIDRTFTRPNS